MNHYPDISDHGQIGDLQTAALGPIIGAFIAVAIIGLVRGLPDKQEREAAQGGALPMQDAPISTAPQQETP